MQKLVIVYQVGDGYTWSGEKIVPIWYESEEAFIVDFEDWITQCITQAAQDKRKPHGEFEVGDARFHIEDFMYRVGPHTKEHRWESDLPEIYTLDQWFDRYAHVKV